MSRRFTIRFWRGLSEAPVTRPIFGLGCRNGPLMNCPIAARAVGGRNDSLGDAFRIWRSLGFGGVVSEYTLGSPLKSWNSEYASRSPKLKTHKGDSSWRGLV